MIDILLLIGLAAGIYAIFSPSTGIRNYVTTTDPNVIKGVMARDVANAQRETAETRARMTAEGYVPREVAEGEEDQYAAWRAIPDDPRHSIDYALGNISKAPTPWGWCRKVIYDEGEAHCSYDRGELSPEQSTKFHEEVFRSFGFRPTHNIPDNDPRWPQIREYQRRKKVNDREKDRLKWCYISKVSQLQQQQNTEPGAGRTFISYEGGNCPPMTQPAMTKEQYIAANFRPLSTKEFEQLIRQIQIEEAGGYENWLWNKQKSKEMSEYISKYTDEKMKENNAKADACWNAYRATWSGEERPAGSKSPDCSRYNSEGLGGDAPWVKAAKAKVLGASTSNYSKVSRFDTMFGMYGGRLTKRRDYV